MVIMVRSWAENVLLHYWQSLTSAALKAGSAQGAHIALKKRCVRKTV